jgi:two-component system, NtrC family, response regulator HydG
MNVFSIAVPPLRERREDIEMLAAHFLKRFSLSMNRPMTGLAREALELLRGYDWPGNVRELQNAMERAVLVARTREIEPGDLPLQLNNAKPHLLGKSLSDIERQHIKNVLEESEWNIYRAARLLEIDRVTLYNKIKKYGFKREEKQTASARG